MRLSYKWLSDFVKLPANRDPSHIAEALTLHTSEVEEVIELDKHLNKVIVGKLVEYVPHPEKQQLHVGKVLTGTGTAQIVFGSVHPVREGELYAIALPGAVLPSGIEIRSRKVHGIESEGMIADDKELGILNSSTGLTTFPPHTLLGTPVSEALQLKDTVFFIDNKAITHRPDLWGLYGFARELAAIYGTELIPYLQESDHRYLGIVAGTVTDILRHPQADNLSIVKVDIGKTTLAIVCSAANVLVGSRVPVATTGTTMPDGMRIDRTEIRGIASEGMLCSPAELELGIGRTVVYLLPENTVAGTPLREVIKVKTSSVSPNNAVKVTVEDTEGCTRFSSVVVDDVSIAESPLWLRSKLIAAGVRPINTVVDITNYVMLELGQPMHAYDRALLPHDSFIVRQAKENQKIRTLDGVDRFLPSTASIVSSGSTPIGIGGVMGGENTEIRETTRTVVFEAACWDPVRIRKTMSRLGLRTEAGMRFEKDLAPELTGIAIQKALKLVFELCPNARQVSPVTTIGTTETGQNAPISLPLNLPEKLTGISIPTQATEDILTRLGFSCDAVGGDSLKVTKPWWRSSRDISIPEDLVEEVARIYGLAQIHAELPDIKMQPPLTDQTMRTMLRTVRRFLSFGGHFAEVMNYSFTGERIIAALGERNDEYLKLKNPIAEQHTYLRTGLLGGLLENAAENCRQEGSFRLFEIGSVYLPETGDVPATPDKATYLPKQPLQVSGIVVGPEDGFFIVKGVIEELLKILHCSPVTFETPQHSIQWIHPGCQAEVRVNGQCIGGIGEIHPKVRESLDISQRIYFFDLCATDILETFKDSTVTFHEIPKYPGVTRDISMIADERHQIADIEKTVRASSTFIDTIELFDVYRDDKIGTGKKSLSFRMTYRSPDKTFTDAEANAMHDATKQALTAINIAIR